MHCAPRSAHHRLPRRRPPPVLRVARGNRCRRPHRGASVALLAASKARAANATSGALSWGGAGRLGQQCHYRGRGGGAAGAEARGAGARSAGGSARGGAAISSPCSPYLDGRRVPGAVALRNWAAPRRPHGLRLVAQTLGGRTDPRWARPVPSSQERWGAAHGLQRVHGPGACHAPDAQAPRALHCLSAVPLPGGGIGGFSERL
jgi:hypothetical protein